MILTKQWQLIASSANIVQSLKINVYARYTSQDIINNRSNIEYKAVATHNTYIIDGQGSWSLSGTGANSTSGTWSRIDGSLDLGIITGQVAHDANGDCVVSCSATLNAPNWSASGSASGSANLPHIDRTAPTITATVTNIGTNSFDLSASANVDCDNWQYRLNGGAWASFNNEGETISGLLTNTEYAVEVKARKVSNHIEGSAQTTVKTIGGIVRVKINGVWKEAEPFIKINGVWKRAIAYIKKNGEWKIGV